MAELSDLMAEVPESILNGEEAPIEDDASNDDTELEQQELVDDGADDDSEDVSEDHSDDDSADDTSAEADSDEDSDDDDYVIQSLNEEKPTPEENKNLPNQITETDEGKYILSKLQPISVRIVTADDKIETVQVYGEAQLPRDFKGFASKYEEVQFNKAIVLQENRALDAQREFRNNRQTIEQQQFQEVVNRGIMEDLQDLRKEGLFPKFKGEPGSKEFDNSEGAKEFDRVMEFMNDYNDKALEASQRGRDFRRIGFREAYTMLHGPNPKAAEQREQQARRAVAQRTATRRGTQPTNRGTLPRVTNINDLADEFQQFVGSNN